MSAREIARKAKSFLFKMTETVCLNIAVRILNPVIIIATSFVLRYTTGIGNETIAYISEHPTMAFFTLSSMLALCGFFALFGLGNYLRCRRLQSDEGLERASNDTSVLFDPETGEFICPACLAEKRQRYAMAVKYDGAKTLFLCPHSDKHTQFATGKLFPMKSKQGGRFKWSIQNGDLPGNGLLYEFYKAAPNLDLFCPKKHSGTKGKKEGAIPLDQARENAMETVRNYVKSRQGR